MNKPLLKFLCQIGGIDFYTVPDDVEIHLRERDRDPWFHAYQMMPSPVSAAALILGTWRVIDAAGNDLNPFLVKYIGGKIAVDSSKAPKGEHGMKAFACLSMVLDDLQFAQAKMLEHPANFATANP